MKKLISLLAFSTCLSAIKAQYVIDSTFNTNGTNEFLEFAGNTVNGQKLAYTATDAIIVAGRWNNQLTVWKYDQDGTTDGGFGENGLSYFPIPSSDFTDVKSVVVQNYGKITVLAEATLQGPNIDFWQGSIVLARFLADGTPDSTFNNTGLVIIKLESGFEYQPRCMSVDQNNRISVGGIASVYGDFGCSSGVGKWFVANFLEDGSLNTGFNAIGYVQGTSSDIAQTFQTDTPFAMVLDVKALPNGKLVAAGALNAQDSCYFSMRFNSDGSYDNAYGLNGRQINPIQAHRILSNQQTYAKILADESILYHVQYPLQGNNGAPDSMMFYVYKATNLGTTETSFGTNGLLTLNEITGGIRLAIDDQNRLVYAWYNRLPAGTQRVYFRRLLPNGSPDLTFSAAGFMVHEPLLNDPFLNASSMNDILFNAANTDLTLVSFRSAMYAPNSTFRVLNYLIDPNYSNLGVENLEEDDVILVYPNPSSGIFSIDVKTAGTGTIYSDLGILVGSWEFSKGVHTIELPNELADGIYLLEISDHHSYSVKKKLIYQK